METHGDHPPPPPRTNSVCGPEDAKPSAKEYCILRTSRKRRNRLEDGVFGLAPPKRAGATPCFPLPEAEFVRLIVGISNANWGCPAHCSVLSDAYETSVPWDVPAFFFYSAAHREKKRDA